MSDFPQRSSCLAYCLYRNRFFFLIPLFSSTNHKAILTGTPTNTKSDALSKGQLCQTWQIAIRINVTLLWEWNGTYKPVKLPGAHGGLKVQISLL